MFFYKTPLFRVYQTMYICQNYKPINYEKNTIIICYGSAI